jgi:hypothetical protein
MSNVIAFPGRRFKDEWAQFESFLRKQTNELGLPPEIAERVMARIKNFHEKVNAFTINESFPVDIGVSLTEAQNKALNEAVLSVVLKVLGKYWEEVLGQLINDFAELEIRLYQAGHLEL